MFKSLRSVFRYQDLRNQFLFTVFIMFIFRAGAHIPVPGIDPQQIKDLFSNNGALGLVDLFSGGALSNFSLFSMGIIPYINASIIMQLLGIVVPQIKEIMEEGESGRRRISQYTRYLSIVIALIQAVMISLGFESYLISGYSFAGFMFVSVTSLVAGSALVMWLGELITVRGIGNGASLIIFAGILASMPLYIRNTVILVKGGTSILNVFALVLIMVIVVLGIIVVQESERRIPIQYTRRVVGRRVYGGQSTYIPLKINQGGVLPIIFASSMLIFPVTIASMLGWQWLAQIMAPGSGFYMFLFAMLIFFFTFFYTAVIFNPQELAENIQKQGGFVPGVRAGKQTSEYLEKIITRLTFVGAVFLSIIAILPMLAANVTRVTSFIGLGGTALLIMVGVALDLDRQINTYLVNQQYENISG